MKKPGPNKKATSSTNTTSKPRQILNRNKDKLKKKNLIKYTHNLRVSTNKRRIGNIAKRD